MFQRKFILAVLGLCVAALFMSCGGGKGGVWENEENQFQEIENEGDGGAQPIPMNPVWTELPGTKLGDSFFDWSSQGGAPGVVGEAGITAFSGAAFDTTRNRLIIHGGGHGDYGGQEIYAFDMDTFTWALVAPPENKGDLLETDCSLDTQVNYGRRTANNLPKSVHTYDRLVYVEQLDALLDGRGSVGFIECNGQDKEAVLWYFSENRWEWWADPVQHIDDLPYPTEYSFGGTGAAAAVHPITKDVWFVPQRGGGRITRWNPTTDVWTQGASDNVLYLTLHKVAVIDSQRNSLIILRERSPEAYLYIVPLDGFAEGVTRAQDYRVTTTGDNGFLSVDDGKRITMDYDPVGDQLVAWAGGSEIYTLDLDTLVWTQHTVPGAVPSAASTAGTYGRFRYVASIDKFVLMRHIGENVFLLDLREGQPVTSFELTSAITGEVPFTTGIAFKKGDVAGLPTLDLENYQVEVKRRWADNSVKHAIVSGVYPSVADESFTVQVFDSGEVPTGTDLTEADIIAAAPTASVQLGTLGTVNLADLLGDPKRIWLQGPEAIEAHYYGTISGNVDGTDYQVAVKFHVRLYADGTLRIRAIVENGTQDYDFGTDLAYVPTVTIDGGVVYDNGGVALNHYNKTRWDAIGWIGGDAQSVIRHDTDYLMASKLVPNYWKRNPSEAVLNGLTTAYTPLNNGDWRAAMPNPGFHEQIGLLPNWDALYLTSGGDARAFRSVITNGRAINSYGIVWGDDQTNDPIVISEWPALTAAAYGGGRRDYLAGSYRWDIAHHGSAGYFPYLLTGDYYFLESLQYQAMTIYLFTLRNAQGVERLITPDETRAMAWATRTYGQLAGIAPTEQRTLDVAAMLNHTAAYWRGIIEQPGMNQLGYFFRYVNYSISATGAGGLAPWQQHFWAQTNGYISDLEYADDMTDFNFVRDHLYKAPVAILGGEGTDSFCFTRAGTYRIATWTESSADPTNWFDSWGDVYQWTFDEPNTSCGNSLQSTDGWVLPEEASINMWGNLLPAIAYAVEDGAPGAAESWQRFTGAENFSTLENSGFEDTSVWNITPRNATPPVED